MTGSGPVKALQAALAAENAAIYGCGAAGAHLSGGQLQVITQAWNAHRARRDQLETMLASRGAEPAAALPAYRLPQPVTDAHGAVSLALLIEDRVASAYQGLVVLPDAALRVFGAMAMQDAAVRAARWRGGPVAFPGLSAIALSSPRGREAVTTQSATSAASAVMPAGTPAAGRRNDGPSQNDGGSPGGPGSGGRSGFIPGKKQPAKPKRKGKGPHGKPN